MPGEYPFENRELLIIQKMKEGLSKDSLTESEISDYKKWIQGNENRYKWFIYRAKILRRIIIDQGQADPNLDKMIKKLIDFKNETT